MNTRYYLVLLLMAEKGCIDEYIMETKKSMKECDYDVDNLEGSFVWSKSNSGHYFWSDIYYEACELIREAQHEN